MPGPTIDELRELSRRSRKAQAVGFAAFAGALATLPLHLVLGAFLAETWALWISALVGGALFVAWAYQMGAERGAFRKVFRRIKDEGKARTLVPRSPEVTPPLTRR